MLVALTEPEKGVVLGLGLFILIVGLIFLAAQLEWQWVVGGWRRLRRWLANEPHPAAYSSGEPLEDDYREPGGPREVLLWVGDGMAPAGPHLLGLPVDLGDGRKGRVVETSLLTITVEWDK